MYARLLQVTAGQFLQQFFNPYYGSSPPASPAQSNSPSNPLANGLLPPGGASLGDLVQQLVASRAQPPTSEPVTAQQPAGIQSTAPSPVSMPPVLATPLPVPALSPADSPAADMSALSQPPSIAPLAQPSVTAADGPSASTAPVSPQVSLNTLALSPAVALPDLPVTGLAGAPGSVLGQGSLLPAGISALATAAVLAEQVRPQVNNLAGIVSTEAGTSSVRQPNRGAAPQLRIVRPAAQSASGHAAPASKLQYPDCRLAAPWKPSRAPASLWPVESARSPGQYGQPYQCHSDWPDRQCQVSSAAFFLGVWHDKSLPYSMSSIVAQAVRSCSYDSHVTDRSLNMTFPDHA